MKIKTIEPVKYSGKRIEPGSVIEVDNAVGKQLIASGAAELNGKTKSEPGPAGGTAEVDPAGGAADADGIGQGEAASK